MTPLAYIEPADIFWGIVLIVALLIIFGRFR